MQKSECNKSDPMHFTFLLFTDVINKCLISGTGAVKHIVDIKNTETFSCHISALQLLYSLLGSGFYHDNQGSWTLITANSMQVSSSTTTRRNKELMIKANFRVA